MMNKLPAGRAKRPGFPVQGITVLSVLASAVVPAGGVGAQVIRPTADFDLNYLNVPTAWTVSRGEGVAVWIVDRDTGDCERWERLILKIAPAASGRCVSWDYLPGKDAEARLPDILLLLPSSDRPQGDAALEVARRFARGRSLIIVPAYSGPMRPDDDIEGKRRFIKSLRELGVLVVGSHGASYELGDVSHWLGMGIRLFALNREARGERYFRYDRLVDKDLRKPAALVAGVATLLKAKEPDLSPDELLKTLVTRGRKVVWVRHPSLGHDDWMTPLLADDSRLAALEVNPDSTLEAASLDAGLSLGLKVPEGGAWSLQTLNLDSAHSIATGRGRVIAILDHEFDEADPGLREKWVAPGSVHQGVAVWGPRAGHGTWMARYAAAVAPGARIMPVRIWGSEGEWARPDRAQALIDGIRYAISHGADVISLSQSRIPKAWMKRFDDAVQEAVTHGVVVVYIHYYGSRRDVVVPHPVAYDRTQPGPDYVYVVGTGFISPETFPNVWGVSAGAPMVAGVVAMIREIAPRLPASRINDVLLCAGVPVDGDKSTLDARRALERALAMPHSPSAAATRAGRQRTGTHCGA